MLSDEEMLVRLQFLYGDEKRVRAIAKSWADMRAHGNGAAVEAVKARYCRRMYNVSQFAKTFKERIAAVINKRLKHVGHVFEGRFYGGLVEGDAAVSRMISLYIDYNPYKANLVKANEFYRWSSFGQANGAGEHAAECRAAYESFLGGSWAEIREMIQSAFADRLPEGDDVATQIRDGQMKVRISQLIKLRVTALTRGPYIGRRVEFILDMTAHLPKKFPRAGKRSLVWLINAVEWPQAS